MLHALGLGLLHNIENSYFNNLALTKLISMLKCLLLQLLSGLNIYFYVTGRGTPIRHVLGKSKMIVGLLGGIPTMLKGEVEMVMFF